MFRENTYSMFDKIKELRLNKSDVILFNSYSKTNTEVLSNFHRCKLTYSGVDYNSVEQLLYIMRLSGHYGSQKALMFYNEPAEIKKRGWYEIKKHGIVEGPERLIPMLRFCLRLKYNQCDEFRNFLLENPDKKLVEYAAWGDDTWGMVDEDEKLKWNWRKGYVRGQNVCGRLIQEVRRDGLAGDLIPELPEGVSLPAPEWFVDDGFFDPDEMNDEAELMFH